MLDSCKICNHTHMYACDKVFFNCLPLWHTELRAWRLFWMQLFHLSSLSSNFVAFFVTYCPKPIFFSWTFLHYPLYLLAGFVQLYSFIFWASLLKFFRGGEQIKVEKAGGEGREGCQHLLLKMSFNLWVLPDFSSVYGFWLMQICASTFFCYWLHLLQTFSRHFIQTNYCYWNYYTVENLSQITFF